MIGFLDGLKVLDFSEGYAGAMATMLLADYGAEVLEVEPPAGDPTRRTAAFQQWHRGKKSAVLDLDDETDRAQAQALALEADIVVTSWLPGVSARYGLDHATLAARNPALVSCEITGFGRKGPLAGVQGYEGAVLARAGVFWNVGPLADGADGPTFIGISPASFGAAHAAAQGILAALYVRARTGRGQEVTTSLAQALTPYDLYGFLTVTTGLTGEAPATQRGLGMIVADTSDGRWIQFANSLPHQKEALIEGLGLRDEWMAVQEGRTSIESFALRARDRIRERPLDEWLETFERYDNVGIEPFRSPLEALDHPQLLHMGQSVSFEDAELGTVRQLGPLARFDGDDPRRVAVRAPALGAHPAAFAAVGERPFMPAGALAPAPLHGPLEGVTLVELAWFYAAPFGATLLAELGARVVKFENPEGDPHRWQWAPAEFCGVKVLHGKESVAVDMLKPEGMEILHRLVGRSDLVLRNFRQSSSEAMGIDFAALAKHNDRLAYLYAGAYGADGPYSAHPAYAPSMSAGGGVHGQVLGRARMLSGEVAPIGANSAEGANRVSRAQALSGIGDSSSAIAAGTGLMLTLLARERTGSAVYAQTTMLGSNAHLVSDIAIDYRGKPAPPIADSRFRGVHALYRLYRAGDGEWVFLAAPRSSEWLALCAALGRAPLAEDPRFANEDGRTANDTELAVMLEDAFTARAASAWEGLLTAAGVCCVEVRRQSFAAFTVDDPVMIENGSGLPAHHYALGAYRRHGLTVTLSETPLVLGPAPKVGEQTRSILAELGYSDAEVAALRDAKVVAWPD